MVPPAPGVRPSSPGRHRPGSSREPLGSSAARGDPGPQPRCRSRWVSTPRGPVRGAGLLAMAVASGPIGQGWHPPSGRRTARPWALRPGPYRVGVARPVPVEPSGSRPTAHLQAARPVSRRSDQPPRPPAASSPGDRSPHLKTGPAGGRRPPSGPATTRQSPGPPGPTLWREWRLRLRPMVSFTRGLRTTDRPVARVPPCRRRRSRGAAGPGLHRPLTPP